MFKTFLAILMIIVLSGCAAQNNFNVRSNTVQQCSGQPRAHQNDYVTSLMEDYGNLHLNQQAFGGQRTVDIRDNCVTIVTPQNSVNALIHIIRQHR